MTPDFALSLSFEGIRLLHRRAEGWTSLGEVPLDSRDLTGDLAALRRAGLSLGVPWRGTKLLLPSEQVRTLALDSPDAGLSEARTALDGATPYRVDDLLIDHLSDGTRTHVAAVARETLAEAEAFAAEHGFQPVSFAADLGTGYPGEAFFGPTSIAAKVLEGEPVTRDVPAQAGVPADDPDDTPQIVRRAAVEAEVPATPQAEMPERPPEPVAEAAPVEPPPKALAPAPVAPGAGTALPSSSPPRAGTPLSATGMPEPVFASRARPLRGETRDGDASDAERPPREAPRTEPRVGPSPRLAGPADTPPAAPTTAARIAIVPPRTEPPVAARPAASRPIVAAPAKAALAASAVGAAVQAPRRTPAAPFSGKPEAAAHARGKPRYLGLILTAVLLVVMATVAVLAAVSDQSLASLLRREPATEVAAAPPSEAATPEPAALVASPAEEARPEAPTETASIEPTAIPQPDIEAAAATVAAALAVMPEATEEPAETAQAATGVWLDGPNAPAQPEAEATLGTAVAADAAPTDTAEALPELAAVAPDAPLATPEPPPVPRAEEPAAVASTEPAAERPATPEPEAPAERTAVASAGPLESPAAAEETQAVAGPPPVLPPTRPGTEATQADSGWVNAMASEPGKVPRLRPEDLAPPEAAVAAQDAPTGAPLQPDSPEELLAALAPGAEPPAGTAGVVDPLLPGALAFAPTAPPSGSVAASPGGVSLAGLRPNARPEDLAPEPPEEPEELAAWEGPRPGSRPEGLAPEEAPSPEVDNALAEALAAPDAPVEEPAPPQPDVQTALASIMANAPDPLAGATRQAVPQARRPDTRPANFGRVVATQLDRLARSSAPRQQAAVQQASTAGTGGRLQPNEQAETEPEAASAAAAVPSGQTAASVAQAATFQDAMALREINLIGVYGQPNARRALVRMGNGSYVRVGVGDRLDGGQVTAIGDNALNYVKRGRTYALVIPGG